MAVLLLRMSLAAEQPYSTRSSIRNVDVYICLDVYDVRLRTSALRCWGVPRPLERAKGLQKGMKAWRDQAGTRRGTAGRESRVATKRAPWRRAAACCP